MKITEQPDRVSHAARWTEQYGPQLVSQLLAWFDQTARDLPWRRPDSTTGTQDLPPDPDTDGAPGHQHREQVSSDPGHLHHAGIVRDPYRVLLSELMLQQTQVATVIPYYERFLASWPTLADLATADEEAVLKAWEGLGYYSRARHLLQTARLVTTRLDGRLPTDELQLRQLPGIGEYTANAIRALAFGLPAAAVDGNIVRVLARLTQTPWCATVPAQRHEVRQIAEQILPADRPGALNEALMDLGAGVCLPAAPRCTNCPVASCCLALATDQVSQLPVKPNKKASPVDELTCLIWEKGGRFHVNRRGPGLLAGLYEFDWATGDLALNVHDAAHHGSPGKTRSSAGVAPGWPGGLARSLPPETRIQALGQRRHVFTHRQWQMNGYWLRLPAGALTPDLDRSGRWVDIQELAALPFPTALAPWREQVLAGSGSDAL